MRLFVKSALFAACAFFFASCDFGFDGDSFQNRAGAYFKEMTSTAAVAAYKIDTDNVQTDRSGNFCFGYESDRTVTFTLRNPQHYSFLTNRNMTLGLAGNDGGAPMPLSETVTLVQDSSDTTKLVLTFPADFLKANPMGANISPVITMMHPVSLAPFTPYKDLKLSSNATPPMPNGAVVMQTTETPSRWVVCFNMPNSAIINEFHSDLESVSVNDSSAKISVNGGIISLESGSDISASEPPGLVSNQNTGLSFSPNGQAIYYSTGDEADEKERVYTVTVTDNAGLVSSFGISTRGFKLSAPDAYLTDDASFANPFSVNYSSAKNFVSQEDDGSSFIYLHGTAKTEAVNYTDSSGNARSIPQYDYDPSNAQILYEVYLEDTFTTLVDSGMIKGLGGKIPVPAGTSYVRAYVRKPLYSDSEVITWWCRSVSTRFFVSEIGDDVMNSGSRDKPYRTIQKAVNMFGEGIQQGDYDSDSACYIKVLGDELTPPDDFDFVNNGGAYINIPDPATVPTMPLASATVNIEGDGGTKTVNLKGRDAKILSASCGNVVLTDINLTGADFSSDSYNEALVEIASAASVRMNSVAIRKNNLSVAATSVINIVKNSGTLRMNDSSVAENTRSIDGSTCVVLNCDGGETTLSNTSILNHHEDWTPAFIAASATFDMTGGEIKDNTESNYIIESNGLVTMTGVTVQNNGNLDASSGIHIVGNKMTLKDCVITKNKADCGAGIMVEGELVLDSCSITENTAADDGAGVFCSSSATKISLKGKNTIYDNHTVSEPAKQNNVYLADSAAPPALPTLKLTIESDISGSKIGLHYPSAFAPTLSASIPFTDGYGYGTKNKEKPGAWFTSDYNYGISDISSNEAAFVVSSGSMYGALDYTFDFELKAADGVTAASVMYFGKDASFVIAPTVARREQGATLASSDLYLNPADKKLYLDAGFTKAAGDESVTLTAKLYSGGSKAEDLDITWEADKISLAVPASKATLPDDYTIKVFRTFLGVDSSSSFAVACNHSAEAAAAYIQSLRAAGTYDVEVEGVVGPGVDNSDGNETTITSSDEGLAKVAKAIRAKNGSDVKISLDARATSPRGTTLADLALYNDGKYFMNCLALTAARLPDWMLDVLPSLFEGCRGLASVEIPDSVVSVGASAFKDCANLATVTFGGTSAEWKKIEFGTNWRYNVKTNEVHCAGDNTDVPFGFFEVSYIRGGSAAEDSSCTSLVSGSGTSADPYVVEGDMTKIFYDVDTDDGMFVDGSSAPSGVTATVNEYGTHRLVFDRSAMGDLPDSGYWSKTIQHSGSHNVYFKVMPKTGPAVPEGFVGFYMESGGTSFQMGQQDITDATPHSVTLTRDFWMCDHEVTQAEYTFVMGTNPSGFNGTGTKTPADGEEQTERPVEKVSWYDAIYYCNKRSLEEHLTPCYKVDDKEDPSQWSYTLHSGTSISGTITCDFNANGYRLPTEAEWEFAARGIGFSGAKTDTENNVWAGTDDSSQLGSYAWYGGSSGVSSGKTHQVCKKTWNAARLYDMSGNVGEWCWDRYKEDYYTTGDDRSLNPAGASSGIMRIFRGGNYTSVADNFSVAKRYGYGPELRYDLLGFRVVRTAPNP